MNTVNYRAILRSIDQALEICDNSHGFMDETHRKICEELRDARERIQNILKQSGGLGLA